MHITEDGAETQHQWNHAQYQFCARGDAACCFHAAADGFALSVFNLRHGNPCAQCFVPNTAVILVHKFYSCGFKLLILLRSIPKQHPIYKITTDVYCHLTAKYAHSIYILIYSIEIDIIAVCDINQPLIEISLSNTV
ncbi:hypothetical protein NQ012_12245 [Neisseria dentiae]|nr:hypothetical protein [Neisseria dentiae]MCQ9327661.1 hypothetical protein [Neisseria dentiae]